MKPVLIRLLGPAQGLFHIGQTLLMTLHQVQDIQTGDNQFEISQPVHVVGVRPESGNHEWCTVFLRCRFYLVDSVIELGVVASPVRTADGQAQRGFQVGNSDHEGVHAGGLCDGVDILDSELFNALIISQ